MKRTLLTTKEAAEYIGITVSYLRKLMMWGEIQYYKPHGKMCYFDPTDIEAWLHRVCIPATTAKGVVCTNKEGGLV